MSYVCACALCVGKLKAQSLLANSLCIHIRLCIHKTVYQHAWVYLCLCVCVSACESI